MCTACMHAHFMHTACPLRVPCMHTACMMHAGRLRGASAWRHRRRAAHRLGRRAHARALITAPHLGRSSPRTTHAFHTIGTGPQTQVRATPLKSNPNPSPKPNSSGEHGLQCAMEERRRCRLTRLRRLLPRHAGMCMCTAYTLHVHVHCVCTACVLTLHHHHQQQ